MVSINLVLINVKFVCCFVFTLQLFVMKKIACFCLLALLSVYCVAQDTTAKKSFTKADFIKKAKRQNLAAWLCLGAGAAGALATAVADLSEQGKNTLTIVASFGFIEPEPTHSYTVPYIISGVVAAASIPFFIASSKNKKLARSATTAFLKMEKAVVPTAKGNIAVSYPALAITFRL
jgi:hypothetical protein